MAYPRYNFNQSQMSQPAAPPYPPENTGYLPYEAQYRPPPENANYAVSPQPDFPPVRPTAPPQLQTVPTNFQRPVPQMPVYAPPASAVQGTMPRHYQTSLPITLAPTVQPAVQFAHQTSGVYIVNQPPAPRAPVVYSAPVAPVTSGVYLVNQPPAPRAPVVYSAPVAPAANQVYSNNRPPGMPTQPQSPTAEEVISNCCQACLTCLCMLKKIGTGS